jgi:hypothetical protein
MLIVPHSWNAFNFTIRLGAHELPQRCRHSIILRLTFLFDDDSEIKYYFEMCDNHRQKRIKIRFDKALHSQGILDVGWKYFGALKFKRWSF